MNSENRNNADTSEKTSKANQPADEQAYLKQQAAMAKKAATAVGKDLLHDAATVANPLTWAEEYPMIGIGSAAAIGFAICLAAIPSRKSRLKSQFVSLVEKLKDDEEIKAVKDALLEDIQKTAERASAATQSAKSEGNSILKMLLHPLLDVAKTAAASAAGAAVRANATHNGKSA